MIMRLVIPNTAMTLGEYIKEQLGERSARAMATYAGIGVGTANNLIKNEGSPDPKTLRKVAEYLNVPPETLFRLAGYLPPEPEIDTKKQMALHLLSQLNDDSLDRMLDFLRLEVERAKR